MPNYYPKGGRCRACERRLDDCSSLDFSAMPVHRRDGPDVIVICTEFRQTARRPMDRSAQPETPQCPIPNTN
ncbi:hypothetical protein ACOANN_04105 [Pseudomonas aeruginosa]|uniref:hypothetical protein n=1 Tax=Pseudomonas aeruginosa TaxID=287 RepID=UPI000E319010|nr:hypothetical protein [Pseudomonas aeruginosa]MWW82042.1 hypothetical protein [Pseudomonas aeruginosa]